ncbi:Amino-acid acetyltransferase [Gammaproteobacteria bacterium]
MATDSGYINQEVRHPACSRVDTIVTSLRNALPYINAHRGRTFVVTLSGETVQDDGFPDLVHDLALLGGLGVRLVLVHGARPQIEARLCARRLEMRYEHGLRVTDDAALMCVLEATGSVRARIEALFSLGLANSPMAGARIRVTSGNFVTARPLGVRNGIDYQHTGEVRRIDTDSLRRHLDGQDIVVLPPIGYSPTGEVFNLSAEEVAMATAAELAADKLIFLVDGPGVVNRDGKLIPQLTLEKAEEWLSSPETAAEPLRSQIRGAVHALRRGVGRVHLISRHTDGALLMELFTRDGNGTLIDPGGYDDLRPATIDDVGGILELIIPLEAQGVLVRRSRERLENEVDQFVVAERDGTIIGCAAFHPFQEESVGELACLAVHSDYRRQRRGDLLLAYIERLARIQGIRRLFVLTTHTAHWFQERGFAAAPLESLPVARQALYNWQRNSKVFIKELGQYQ